MWLCSALVKCIRVHCFHYSVVMPRSRKRKSVPETEDVVQTDAVKGESDGPDIEPPPAKKVRGSSKGKAKEEVDGAMMSKSTTSSKESSASSSKKTDWDSVKWTELGKTKDGRSWTKKFSSWNVNGIRAWLKNGGFDYIKYEDADIFCVQETKCHVEDLPMDKLSVPGYHVYWHSAEQKGYSGVGLFTKEKPLSVTNGLGIDKYDCEGRLITAEYDDFYFLTAYVPNAGQKLKRLDFKQSWDADFKDYMKKLDAKKPVILCGDLNVAHQEIDLKNPKTNTATAGFTPEEREDFTQLLNEGFVDTFRSLYPDLTHAYSYWSYKFNARQKNTGWRLDYFVVSERLMCDVCDSVIRKEVYGSDHCPIVLSLAGPTETSVDPSPSDTPTAENEAPPPSDSPTPP